MSAQPNITKEVTIQNGLISVNDEVVFERPQMDIKELLRASYQQLGMEYPKFFKMDLLCQLAIIGSEILLRDTQVLAKYPKDRISILLSNSSSSLDTDRRYYDTIKNGDSYFPSPVVFVYTLPSIMCGEIAIRNGIQGENNFLITESYDETFIEAQVSNLFAQGHTDVCISGWVQLEGAGYGLVMFLAER
ncbi:hypothetical protein BH09BAC1_BH09BAC1_17310 [soil metagenome]